MTGDYIRARPECGVGLLSASAYGPIGLKENRPLTAVESLCCYCATALDSLGRGELMCSDDVDHGTDL